MVTQGERLGSWKLLGACFPCGTAACLQLPLHLHAACRPAAAQLSGMHYLCRLVPQPLQANRCSPASLSQDGEYGAAQLRAIFAAHGPVEDVVLREGKKRKGSALVVMADAAGAAAAAGAVNGTLINPLLVVPFNKAAAAADGGEDAGAAAGSGLGGKTVDASATRLPPAATALVFAAGAVPAGGLGPRPAAPLFAAGARSGSGAAAAQQPAAPLFAAAGAPSSFSARPAFAAGSSGQPPARAAFAAAAAGGSSAGSVSGGSAAAFPAAFSSFGGLPGGGSSGVHALNGKLEDATLARMRQAEERRRLVEELEQQERQAG